MVKRLDLTATVYVLFLSMCFLGVSEWRHIYQGRSELLSPSPSVLGAEVA